MDTPPALALHPAHLFPGSVVGCWQVVARAGCGVHGFVYRAVRVGQEQAQPVALKLAVRPGDPRMAREGELLSRTCHPSIPRLVDQGQWRFATGADHPYVVMEWIEGVPLYEWAQQHAPSPSQVLRMLAQLASALHELHSHGGVHRDVKGGNILVRHSDGRAMLTDFGTGIYPGAVSLTPPACLPSTPAYRSPEAAVLELNALHDPSARHGAQPADDLYALGVTACRLLTGEYPEPSDTARDEHGHWHVVSVRVPARFGQIEPRLRAFIQRLLSVRPEERGTAAQLARELEQAAEFPVRQSPPPGPLQPQPPAARTLPWWPALAVAAAGLALAAWVCWATLGEHRKPLTVAQRVAAGASHRNGGTAGLGQAAAAISPEAPPSPAFEAGMAEEPLPEPVPGQTKPDAKGRCPRKRQVALNGGCWLGTTLDHESCEELNGYVFKGTCYMPIMPPGHPRTSHPTRKR